MLTDFPRCTRLQKGINVESIIYQMTILRIITSSSMEKSLCDQPIDSGINRYDKNRKLTAIQGEDYPVGYLLDYEHIKHHYSIS